jgi:hypothetical protein
MNTKSQVDFDRLFQLHMIHNTEEDDDMSWECRKGESSTSRWYPSLMGFLMGFKLPAKKTFKFLNDFWLYVFADRANPNPWFFHVSPRNAKLKLNNILESPYSLTYRSIVMTL